MTETEEDSMPNGGGTHLDIGQLKELERYEGGRDSEGSFAHCLRGTACMLLAALLGAVAAGAAILYFAGF